MILVIALFAAIGVAFVPTGVYLLGQSNNVNFNYPNDCNFWYKISLIIIN